MRMGELRPSSPPMGGHRGPMYVGDLAAVVKRNAYRSDLHFEYNERSVKLGGAPAHCCGVRVGDPDPRRQGKIWLGYHGNVHRGMVPEWTIVMDASDPDSAIYTWGWRKLVRRWLHRKVLRPSQEIRNLLGESDFFRYMGPNRS